MIRFARYTHHNPEALPVDWAADDVPDGDDYDPVVSAAGFDPDDEEIGMGRLTGTATRPACWSSVRRRARGMGSRWR
jgi:hypothetical protein